MLRSAVRLAHGLPRVAPLALLGIPSTSLRLPRVAPLALLGIPSTSLRLSRVALLALLGIPYGALRLEICGGCRILLQITRPGL
jgi:hypothetical protein